MEKLGQMDPVKPLVTVKLKNRPMDPFTASIIKAEYAKKKRHFPTEHNSATNYFRNL